MAEPARPSDAVDRPGVEETRRRILDAAVDLFAERSFDGASTRDIATRAGVSQPSLAYHFKTKDDLWRAAVEGLFAHLSTTLTARVEGLRGVDRATTARLVLKEFILYSAAHPQLHRIVLHEGTAEGERFEWLIDNHVRPLYQRATGSIAALADGGVVADLPPELMYHIIIGAGVTPFVQAPAVRRLTGEDPFDPARVEAHADAVVGLLFPRPPHTSEA